MNNYIKLFFICLVFLAILIGGGLMAEEKRDIIHMSLKDGVVVIETKPDLAPKHVEKIVKNVVELEDLPSVFEKMLAGETIGRTVVSINPDKEL